MFTKTAGRVAVPGAALYYEVTGRGPVLLLVGGGGSDTTVFDGVVAQLATQYTVVTYDPRGSLRSPYEGEPADVAAEDALAVLGEVAGDVPVYVFGSGSGAITALELLIRHPDRIRLLVAHEPPAISHAPDLAALIALEDKLVPAVGTEPSDGLPTEPIIALSERVGWDVIAFPGGHDGYTSHPFEFATLLQRVLTGALR
jgi:pimeloyl-ACP methyl ester carboxylesterase